jgi:hypothetical protein
MNMSEKNGYTKLACTVPVETYNKYKEVCNSKGLKMYFVMAQLVDKFLEEENEEYGTIQG